MSATARTIHADRVKAAQACHQMRRNTDAESVAAMSKPTHGALILLFAIGYLAVLVLGCWLAGVDIAIAHAWHWLGHVL